MPHVLEVNHCLIQSKTAQDMVATGADHKSGTAFIVIADGHGTGRVIERARCFNWNQLLEMIDVDIQTIIQPFIDEQSVPETEMDGMTLSIVRTRSNYYKNGNILQDTFYIDGKQNYDRESEHQDIYFTFMTGSVFSDDPIEGWLDLSYDQKIAEISKRYPDYSVTYIGKIISDQKKYQPERPLTL